MASTNFSSVTTPEYDTPMARFLAETPLSPLPTSTPTEPKAMSIAKARTPQKGSKHKDRYRRSESPSPPSPRVRAKHQPSDHVSSSTESKKHSSNHLSASLVILPSRKRTGEQLSPSLATKRRASQEYNPTPIPKGYIDHWSPGSSRLSSPARPALRVVPVPVPAANWYPHLKSSSSTSSPEIPRQRVATPSPTAAKKYPSLLSVTVPKLDDEAEKRICYNCGQKGHWFMDCLLGCGKCGNDGHRTIDCSVVKWQAIHVVKENLKKKTVR
jgi:hypothetical protein